MIRPEPLLALAAVAALVAGCGSRAPHHSAAAAEGVATPLPPARADAAASPPHDGGDLQAGHGDDDTGDAAGGGAAPASEGPAVAATTGETSTASPTAHPSEGAPPTREQRDVGEPRLEVLAEPSCVHPGDEAQVTILTEPHALVAMAVRYPQDHGDGHAETGQADGQGRWVYPFTIDPAAPPGDDAVVLASIRTVPDGRSRDGLTTFRIVGPVEACP